MNSAFSNLRVFGIHSQLSLCPIGAGVVRQYASEGKAVLGASATVKNYSVTSPERVALDSLCKQAITVIDPKTARFVLGQARSGAVGEPELQLTRVRVPQNEAKRQKSFSALR